MLSLERPDDCRGLMKRDVSFMIVHRRLSNAIRLSENGSFSFIGIISHRYRRTVTRHHTDFDRSLCSRGTTLLATIRSETHFERTLVDILSRSHPVGVDATVVAVKRSHQRSCRRLP